ncbi:hypothetical protein CDL60_02075 [Roseateles noduli]|nr:hypothetical protein CDL60_02075 [Roseateles noduli]
MLTVKNLTLSLIAVFLLTACAQVGPPAAPGSDLDWQQRTPAVAYLRYSPLKNSVVHALRVDLRRPGVQVLLTPQAEAGRTLPDMPGTAGAVASVNGSFFTRSFTTRGLTVSDGIPWRGTFDLKDSPLIACDARSDCAILLQAATVPEPAWTEVVAGTPWLLADGRQRTPEDDARCAYLCALTHPRTAVGLDDSRRWLYLVAAEGRHGAVPGLTLTQLSTVMRQLGAHNAFNLDGGGSTTLLLQGESMAARPSSEPALRAVANALVIRER